MEANIKALLDSYNLLLKEVDKLMGTIEQRPKKTTQNTIIGIIGLDVLFEIVQFLPTNCAAALHVFPVYVKDKVSLMIKTIF